MKKTLNLFFIVLLFVVSNSVTSQIFYKNGTVANTLSAVNPSSTTNLNMGIGTNTPKSKLDIEGNVAIGTSYSGGTTAAPANGAIIEGNVGIGTNAPTTKLEVKSDAAGVSGVKLTNLNNLSPTTTGNGTAISVDATGNMVLVPVINATPAVTNTLYNNNDSLAADRIVGMGGKKLTFATSITSGTPFLSINGTNGNVGIGLLPTDKGKLQITGENNGQVYVNMSEVRHKTLLLNIGSLVGGSDPSSVGNRLLTFIDRPISNFSTVAESYFSIEDRNDANRFRHYAQNNGWSYLQLSDKTQHEYFKIFQDPADNEKISMQMGKPDSRFAIGGYLDDPNSIGHKFFIKAGSAKIEGNILTDSNIGIGTSSFLDGTDSKTYRLSVKGRIRAEEVKVYNTWADYVFNKNYKLPALKEVEGYIKENGHLPNVPSAKEVTEKGLELGEMSKIQQEKIEELTLYLIQQNKEIEELKVLVKLLMDKKK
ncbi:conserved exported hypothetical protein [Flavobacterium psychrophilum]|uniref:hypothetical protein n=1 Tax=Flavobacterium psychrophilum TaxID=96345 RepID=UPI000B7C1CDE|nr:hypothetical protein [Flavobacterium psychrophilum]SNB23784.1 conserved exported hypothetical protein [Flavobacterium psychrophilum]